MLSWVEIYRLSLKEDNIVERGIIEFRFRIPGETS
jgi:hypothetical protein